MYDLLNGYWERVGVPVKVQKNEASEQKRLEKSNTPYARLWAAGQRLLTVIKHNEGGANKDLAKFMGQINSLCDKWDR